MNRSRSQLDGYQNRHLSLHKPGVMPHSSRRISPITSNGHKYELKQKIWPKQTVESWFQNHTPDDRRAVYSFLNTLYVDEDHQAPKADRAPIPKLVERREKSLSPKLAPRVNSGVTYGSNQALQRQGSTHSGRAGSRASKRDLGEILESLESLRPSLLVQDKGIQTSATPITVALPDVHGVKVTRKSETRSKRPPTSTDTYTEVVQPTSSSPTAVEPTPPVNAEEDTKVSRRYLSHTWRVINPREDMETNVRPDNNYSSFFSFTKKVYPEYFFIHPDWY